MQKQKNCQCKQKYTVGLNLENKCDIVEKLGNITGIRYEVWGYDITGL